MSDRDPQVVDFEQQIGALIQKLANRKAEIGGEGTPFITCWASVYEYETHQLVDDNAAGRGVIVPEGQSISASVGLSVFLGQSFEPGWAP